GGRARNPVPGPRPAGGTCGAHGPRWRISSCSALTSSSASSSCRSMARSFGSTRSAMNAFTCASRSVGGAHATDVMELASHVVRLGFYMGYAQPGTSPLELVELAREAERLGYDSAWAAEAWGVDAVTPLAWLGAQTTTLKLGTAIMQLPGRSPANAAMTAATMDLLSGGRFLLGL